MLSSLGTLLVFILVSRVICGKYVKVENETTGRRTMKAVDSISLAKKAKIDEIMKQGANVAQQQSRININQNLEKTAIDMGKIERARDIANPQRKPLLCVVFLQASLRAYVTILNNILHAGDECDWALIMFDGTSDDEKAICSDTKMKRRFKYCRIAPQGQIRLQTHTGNVPKSLMYNELVPLLPSYEKVFLMDEDISILKLDIKKFLRMWDHAFSPPPLVVQPLIAEATQYYKFLHAHMWNTMDTKYVASAVGYVEQQVPMLDAAFFKWFITQVLKHTKALVEVNGVEWPDKYWCGAAKAYGEHVLGLKNMTYGCGLIIGAGAVNHLNTHSMVKRYNNVTKSFRDYGFEVTDYYRKLFPSWRYFNNTECDPLHSVFGKNYPKISKSEFEAKNSV